MRQAPGSVTDRPAAGVSLSSRSRRVRVVAAGAVLALLTVGTVVGQDSDFPLGPFRMYATRDDPNGTVYQAAVLATTSDGTVHDVTDTSGAPRRAELEGRMPEFTTTPSRFDDVAPLFAHDVDGRAVTSVRLVWREFALSHGRSRPPVDVTVANWTASP